MTSKWSFSPAERDVQRLQEHLLKGEETGIIENIFAQLSDHCSTAIAQRGYDSPDN